jgi:hypothetical protein
MKLMFALLLFIVMKIKQVYVLGMFYKDKIVPFFMLKGV